MDPVYTIDVDECHAHNVACQICGRINVCVELNIDNGERSLSPHICASCAQRISEQLRLIVSRV